MPLKWYHLLGLILLLGCAGLVFYTRIENFFVFFPQSSFDLSPDDLHLAFKDAYFESEDGETLHGWFFPVQGADHVFLFCHGNAGNISHRLDNIRLLLNHGIQVFIFDYRGFGKSSGRPSERGIYLDGLAACDYLVENEHIPLNRIILFGRSLGSAVALELASRRKVKSLILESAFTSTRGMARSMLLFSLLSPMLPANYNNLGKIPRIDLPKLIIHGEEDELVPFSMGRKLFDAAPPSKFFFPVKGAGHNDTYLVGGEQYLQVIASFVKNSRI